MGKPVTDSHTIPFQGGVDLANEIAVMPSGAFSKIQNMRPRNLGFEKRKGEARLSTTTAKTNISPLSIYEYVDSSSVSQAIFTQYADGSVYKETVIPTAPGSPITGNFGTEILAPLADVTGLQPASFTSFKNLVFMTDGVRPLQTYPIESSNEATINAFIVYKGTAPIPEIMESGGTDYTVETQRDDAFTAPLNSLSTLANGHCIFVCFPMPVNNIQFYMSAFNSNVSTMTVKYRKANQWQGLTITDGTRDAATSTKTLAQNGSVSWTAPADEIAHYLFSRVGFWYQISFDAALDSSVAVSYLRFTKSGFSNYEIYPSSLRGIETVNLDYRQKGTTVPQNASATEMSFFEPRLIKMVTTTIGTVYTVTINGYASNYTSVTGDVKKDVLNGIKAAINANANINTIVVASLHASGEGVLVKAITYGTKFTLTVDADLNLTGDYMYLTTLSPVSLLLGVPVTALKAPSVKSSKVELKYDTASGWSMLKGEDWDALGFSYEGGPYITIAGSTKTASVVTYSSVTYTCIKPHVSSLALNRPSTGTNWKEYWEATGTGGSAWADATQYYKSNNSTFVVNNIVGTDMYVTLEGTTSLNALQNEAAGSMELTISATEIPAISSIEAYNGTDYESIDFIDGTEGFTKIGTIILLPGTGTPTQTQFNGYYGYQYRISLSNKPPRVVYSISYLPKSGTTTDQIVEGEAAISCARWANRICYTFKGLPYVFVSKTEQPLTFKNDPDTDMVPVGDGRMNNVLAQIAISNDLIVFQEEKGKEGGCVTYLRGYAPYFSTSVISPDIGILNSRCLVSYSGFEMRDVIAHRPVQDVIFWLSRNGVYVMNYDGLQPVNISGAIAKYFDPSRAECIRKGYENKHYLAYDPVYGGIRIGLVSGTSATTPNAFFYYDITKKQYYMDTFAAGALSCITTIQGNGTTPYIPVGGGQDGFMYWLNTGTNDHTSAIDAITDVEIDGNGRKVRFSEDTLVCKAQTTGNIERKIFVDGSATAAHTKNFTMINSAGASYKGDSSLHKDITGSHFTIRYRHNTTSESMYLLKAGFEIEEIENNVRY